MNKKDNERFDKLEKTIKLKFAEMEANINKEIKGIKTNFDDEFENQEEGQINYFIKNFGLTYIILGATFIITISLSYLNFINAYSLSVFIIIAGFIIFLSSNKISKTLFMKKKTLERKK